VARLAAELPGPRATPFTFWYLVVLLVSTVVIKLVAPATAAEILTWSSTSSANLHRHPVLALIASALWVDGPFWWPYLILFSLVIAPVERRAGSWWTVAVFASGHVVATLASELPIGWQVRHHLLPRAMAHLSDFGVSYGFFSVLGVAILMLNGRPRLICLALSELVVLLPLVTADQVDVSAVGHPLALHIGLLGWLAWVRGRGLIGGIRLNRPPPTRP
jgi:hypothetical protein